MSELPGPRDRGPDGTPWGPGVAATLVARYAYPAGLRRCWVRANMISSLDGADAVEGTSGALGGPNDKAVFDTLRELADVVVVGAATVRAERYGGVRLDEAQRARRAARGQPAAVPIAILTGHADLEPASAVFTETDVAPLIVTAGATVAQARARFGAAAGVLDATPDPDPDNPGGPGDPTTAAHPRAGVSLPRMLAGLAERGLYRVLVEGGPGVLGGLLDADLIDELCLTVAPVLVGGRAGRIVSSRAGVERRLRCGHVLTDDAGYLYLRYLRAA